MHFHYIFTPVEILWTLTFASELVLLIVLLGRDRARRFPWFTVNIAMMALLLLTTKLLFGRLAPLPASEVFLVLSDTAAVVFVLVAIEVARRAFAGAPRAGFSIVAFLLLAIAGGLVALWGPWPAWKTLTGGSTLANLRLMQMLADKGAVFAAILDVELSLAILLAGRPFRGGWRTHAQKIAIGLSTAGLSQIAVRGIWQLMATHTLVRSQAQYERLMSLRDRMYQANNVVFLCVLGWWIAWLWLDERGPGQSLPQSLAASRPMEADVTHGHGA